MYKTKIAKIITVLILIFILIGSVQVFATAEDPFDKPETWKPTIVDDPEITQKAGKVLGIISGIGVIVAVVVLVGIGIKFMLGSVEEKAEYKKTLIPYIIGAFLLIAATTVPKIIYTLTNSVL